MNGSKIIEKYFFFFLLLIAASFVGVILFPFFRVIVIGISISVVLYPLYLWIEKYTSKKHNWIPSLLTTLVFLVGLCIPLYILGSILFNQFQSFYYSLNTTSVQSILTTVGNSLNNFLPNGIAFDIQKEIGTITSSFLSNIQDVFYATAKTVLMFTIFLLIIFYFLKEGSSWKKKYVQMSLLNAKHNEKVLNALSNTINGTIKGYLIISVLQGLLMGVGLALFGVPHAVLWGFVAGIASLIPTIGTALVSIPIILYLFSIGETGNAIGLSIWSATFVGTIDNFLSPYIVSKQIQISPLFILLSVLGGITLMGPVGIIIGPLAISLLNELIIIYREESLE